MTGVARAAAGVRIVEQFLPTRDLRAPRYRRVDPGVEQVEPPGAGVMRESSSAPPRAPPALRNPAVNETDCAVESVVSNSTMSVMTCGGAGCPCCAPVTLRVAWLVSPAI